MPQGPHRRKREPVAMPSKAPQSAWRSGRLPQQAQLRADPVPHFLAQCSQRLDRPDHDLEFDHFAGLAELDEINTLELPFADIGAKFQRRIVRTADKRPMIAKILEILHHRRQHQQGRRPPGDRRLHERRAKHNMF